jgi:hypothetical protein
MIKFFLQAWGGTILYILTVALLPDSRKYIDFIVEIAQAIKKFWVEEIIKNLMNFIQLIVHLF